jgi:hypothetical protein
VSSSQSNVERMRLFVERVQERGRFELIDELVATHKLFRGRHSST